MEILVKKLIFAGNRKFPEIPIFSSKIAMSANNCNFRPKIIIFVKEQYFRQKSQVSPKIIIFAKNQYFHQKSKFSLYILL